MGTTDSLEIVIEDMEREIEESLQILKGLSTDNELMRVEVNRLTGLVEVLNNTNLEYRQQINKQLEYTYQTLSLAADRLKEVDDRISSKEDLRNV